MNKKLLLSSLLIVCISTALLISGCTTSGSRGGSNLPSSTPPVVNTVSPADEDTGMAPDITITVAFSKDMDESTINESNITLTDSNGNAAEGTVTYNAATRTVTFTPAARLVLSTKYTFHVSTNVTDTNGNALASEFTSSFTVRNGEWNDPKIIDNSGDFDASQPKAAADPEGNAITVWKQWDGERFNIWANRYVPGTGWGTSESIENENKGNAENPRVAVDRNGNAIAIWHQWDGARYNVWANRYVPGTGWGNAQTVDNDNGDAENPQIGVDANGYAIAVWTQKDSVRDNIWASRYIPKTGWSTPQLIETNNEGWAFFPQIAVDPSGNATAVWYQWDGARNNVWTNRYTPSAGWGAAELLETDNAASAGSPQIAVDPLGNATAIWTQSDGSSINIMARRYVPGTGWGNIEVIENGNANAYVPQIAVDPSGNATAVWYQRQGLLNHIRANRYVPQTGWGADQLIETDDKGHAYDPYVAMDSIGNAMAVWRQNDGTGDNVYSNRYDINSGWGTPKRLDNDNGPAENPHVAMDPKGNTITVWRQWNGTAFDIWARVLK